MKKILNLQCINCGKEHKTSEADFLCTACGGNLEVNYDYKLISRRFSISKLKDNTHFDMWRYMDLLPINDHDKVPHVHVGWTPMYNCKELAHELDISTLLIKDEGRNPTGSIKDRGSAVAVARALELDKEIIADASTGNASDSLACLTASLPMKSVIFTPTFVPEPKLVQLLVYGAEVISVEGTYDNAFDLCRKAVEENGWYSRAAGFNPYTREGKKTCAFEICEQLEWEAPDKVIVAAGDGTVLSGLWKGFVDFNKLGIIEHMPQMIAVQAAGSAAIKNAFEHNMEVTPVQAHTVADSILVSYPRDAQLALRTTADREVRVRGKGKGRCLFRCQVVRHIAHAGLLAAAHDQAEGVVWLDAKVLHALQGVQAQHGRTLVVRYAAAVDVAVLFNHIVRVVAPAVALRNNIEVTEQGDLLLPAAISCAARVVIIILGGKAHLLAHLQRLVQHLAAALAVRRLRIVAGLADALDVDQRSDIVDDILSIICNKFVDSGFHLF